MKDYSDWEPVFDYENESPYVNPNRPWLKHRSPKVPRSMKFDPIPVHEFIKVAVNKFPNNVCVYHKETDKKYTYRELVNYADRIANALHELGVGKGDAVGIMSVNCPEFLFCFLGVLETGATLVPINPLLTESDVTHIVRESGHIKVIFSSKANYRTIKKALKQVEVEHVILIATDEAKEGTITLDELINGKPAKPPDVDIDTFNDIAALLFTGGTTGLPKGVMLTHYNVVAAALSGMYNTDVPIEENFGIGVFLSILPLCHAMGFEYLICVFHYASMMVMFPFNPTEVLEYIEYYQAKLFVGVPVMYQMIINSPDFTERDLSSLEGAGCGSAALAPELAKKWEKVVGFKISQGYGLTETSAFSHGSAVWLPEIRPESVGVPIMNTDAIIVNPDTLEELKQGEVGEILIKGPQIMKGYWKRPEATKKDIVHLGNKPSGSVFTK